MMMDSRESLLIIPAWFKNATYVLAAIAGISDEAYTAFALLMLIDVVTGVLASAKISGWRAITSKRLSFGLISKLLLLFIPLSIALAGRSVGANLEGIVDSSFFVLTVSELYSVIGNIYTVKNGVRVPEFDAISVILSNIRRLLNKIPTKDS